MALSRTPAAILRTAIDESPYSIRSLARALSERDDVDAQPESIRRSLGKFLGGEPIGAGWADILEEHLGLPSGCLYERNFSQALTLAAKLVKRLEAGEKLPRETLLALAEETERAGEAAHLFAARLRREAAALG